MSRQLLVIMEKILVEYNELNSLKNMTLRWYPVQKLFQSTNDIKGRNYFLCLLSQINSLENADLFL